MTTLRVAAAQISPVLFDARATAERVVGALAGAAAQRVDVVAFGECFLPGYPGWLSSGGGARFDDPTLKDAYRRYLSASVTLDGPELGLIRAACKEHGVWAVLGALERAQTGSTGYCSAIVVRADGEIELVHRKLVPTYEERLVWGAGDGHGLRTFRIGGATLSVLNCWENWMPLARTALYAQGTQVHFALWPGTDENTRDITRFVAREGRVFVVSAGARMSLDDVPHDFALGQELGPAWTRNGGSAVAGPDGAWVVPPDTQTEGLVIAELDLNRVLEERQNFDPVGHYSRPDVLSLRVDRRRSTGVEYDDEPS